MEAEKKIGRRDLLRVFGAGAAIAASAGTVQEAAADSESADERRKPRYQAKSPDVQAFYRVNRYPAN